MENNPNKRNSKIIALRWFARICSTAIIGLFLFIGVGAKILDGGSGEPRSFGSSLIALFIIFLIVGIITSWRWEGVGGIILTICALGGIIALILSVPEDFGIALLLGGPFLICGIIYLICWRNKRKLKTLGI